MPHSGRLGSRKGIATEQVDQEKDDGQEDGSDQSTKGEEEHKGKRPSWSTTADTDREHVTCYTKGSPCLTPPRP